MYRARLYPIGPGESRRVVVRYAEWLARTGSRGERRLYVYPMAAEGPDRALPQIEEKANDLLDRLSNGTMSIRFVTQAAYKNAKRDDMKETLDIQISDSAGIRDYEMFSGGEAFRVNFAIRLALSHALSQRKGARLQTLIIDEGFGSQDAQGRQRLVEAINQIKGDFAKILVITHLDSLKEAFPTQIVVEKGEGGSVISVV